jgi:ATP-dependent Clp protease ATP-binding subunit ClpA
MIDLGTYKDRFAESGQRVFESAVQDSRRRDQNYIAVEHILNALAAEETDLSTT